MFNKIFGKKNSIQRKVVTTSAMYILITAIITMFLFYAFVHKSINMKLVEINIAQEQEAKEVLNMSSRSIRIAIIALILTNVLIIASITRKMLRPIEKITDATKKVAGGDFTVHLETDRKDEIGELTNNFNKMVKELNSIECLQKDFINNVSHEIKTPISSIQGFANLLESDDLLPEERKEYSGIIKEETDRLLYLTTNILKLARLENQERLTKTEEICIAEQIRKAISVLEPKWKEKKIKFNVSLKETKISGEKELLFQVWMNLIENGIKYSNENGQIDIKMKDLDDSLVIKIKDYGKGMNKEECQKIFDRFYQVDKTHFEKGAGLRTCNCKKNNRIIKRNNRCRNSKRYWNYNNC